MVAVLCCTARAAAGEERPDSRLQEAQTAFDEANKSWEAGKYADAIANGEHALALREAVLGSTHPEVASGLDMLGLHYLLMGNLTRAEPLLERALAIREAALGEHHPDVAQTLNNLGKLYSVQELYDRAEPLYARALSIREAALGKDHLLVAETLNNLASLCWDQGVYDRAESLYARALSIREAALGENHLEVAEPLNGLGAAYLAQGRYGLAEPLLKRALTIREAALGNNHPGVAEPLSNLATVYAHQGKYALAEPLLERALAIEEAALDKNPPDVAWTLDNLAFSFAARGLYARAEPLFLRALAMREAVLGKNHLLVTQSLQFLSLLYVGQGVYGQAESVLERSLAIREAVLGRNHLLVATTLDVLSRVYVAQGLYARAEPLLERVLAIRKAAFSEEHPIVGNTLLRLGKLYVAQGQYARAEPLLQRALAQWEANWGKNSLVISWPLGELGNLYMAQGLYRRAEPLLQRALALRDAGLPKSHPDIVTSLNNLADLYVAQGSYGQAELLYERALSLLEATGSKHHPGLARALNHLAVTHLAQHRLAEALPLFARAFAISEQRLRQEALGFSEARLASFLQFLRTDEERLYALLRAHPDDASVRRLALTAALLLKGRSIEESAEISRTIYQSLDAQDRSTFERLRELRTQLTQLSLQPPGSRPLTASLQRLEELSEQSAALEADLAQRSAPLRALATLPGPAEIVDRVAAALPKDSALVEFITYVDRPLVPQPSARENQVPSQLRYVALVLFPDATTRAIDLGPAEPIDSAVSLLRKALADRDAAFQASSQELYWLAFQPLLRLLGKTRRLFLSPDGQLALVPFAALYDGSQFLVDAFDFTYLPSGKNLLPRPQESVPSGSVIVLADPDFSASLQAPMPLMAESPARAERSPSVERFFPTLSAELARRAWAPASLPGTRQEAEAIQRLLPQAQLFLGSEATKERLLHLSTPGILHLATHGFFLEDAPEPTASRAVGQFGALGEEPLAPSPPDPLLRSGLVFGGTRASAPSGSSPAPLPSGNALVTALELAGLNLWGTQLVVLSACDTGRGDIKLGQGVYGLRRAFLVAGAETVVMSLWKVNDATTRELMEGYYRHLMEGQGRATALREAMRELRKTQAHPYYWAPFIAMGEDTPLRWPAHGAQEAH